MTESKHINAVRKLLETQGGKPETIQSTLELIQINEKEKNLDTIKSWLSIAISLIAVVISSIALFYKKG